MSLALPCPLCEAPVAVDDRQMGTYVTCSDCQGTFLVLDEATLPDGAFVAATSAENSFAPMPSPVAPKHAHSSDDSLDFLPTLSLFLGGVSLALVCVPPLAILTAIPGLCLGLLNLDSPQRSRAITGTLLNVFALLSAIVLLTQAPLP